MTKEEILSKVTVTNFSGIEFVKPHNCLQAMEEYANLRLSEQQSKHEQELKKLYEWVLNDKKEPAQTYFSSGIVRNIAREVEFKHEQEMKEFYEFMKDYDFIDDSSVGKLYADTNMIGSSPCYTIAELLTKFKNR